MGSDGTRTDAGRLADRHAAALRPQREQDVRRHDGLLPEWLGELGIDAEITAMESNKLDQRDPRRRPTTSSSGAGTSSPTRTRCSAYLTCDQRGDLDRLLVLQRGVRRALRRSRAARPTTRPRQEIVKQMQEILYDDAPYLVTAYTTIGEAYRNDRFACFQPQPDPGGILLVQYGIHNYLSIRPGRRRRRLRRRRDRARRGGLGERRRRRQAADGRGRQHEGAGRRRRAARRAGGRRRRLGAAAAPVPAADRE